MPLQPAQSAAKASRLAAARNHFQFHGSSGTVEAVRGSATKGTKSGLMLLSTARAAICFATILVIFKAHGDDNSFAAQAERAFTAAQESTRKEPTNLIALVRLARAAF